MNKPKLYRLARTAGLVLILLSTACQPFLITPVPAPVADPVVEEVPALPTPEGPVPTPLPAREPFEPGTLVEYIAQTGDSLTALAFRFNTTESEIRKANPVIPDDATTMPPGFPMQIPIYYRPLWGTPYQILPDSLFVNGPAQRDFDAVAFVDAQPGWLKNYSVSLATGNLRGGEIVGHVTANYSISPRLFLARLEYQLGALTSPEVPESIERYSLGYRHPQYPGLLRQLTWAANTLNNAYYSGMFELLDALVHLVLMKDSAVSEQTPATVALQY